MTCRFCLLTGILLTITLSGCGTGKDAAEGPEAKTVPEKEASIPHTTPADTRVAPTVTEAPIDMTSLLACLAEPLAAKGNYLVVNPRTSGPTDDAKTRTRVKDDFRKRHLDIDGLVDALFDRNRESIDLLVPSDQQRGYVVDANGTYSALLKPGRGGWAQWFREHPKAKSMTTISVPVYDASSGILLIYISSIRGDSFGSGYIRAYKYKDGKLELYEYNDGKVKIVGEVLLWVS